MPTWLILLLVPTEVMLISYGPSFRHKSHYYNRLPGMVQGPEVSKNSPLGQDIPWAKWFPSRSWGQRAKPFLGQGQSFTTLPFSPGSDFFCAVRSFPSAY